MQAAHKTQLPIPLGTYPLWVGRGSMTWDLFTIILHMHCNGELNLDICTHNFLCVWVIHSAQYTRSIRVCPFTWYTPKAVVIDSHFPRQPLISSYVPDWPLPPGVYIPSESEMALRARIYAYNRHLSFDVAFICSTLTHCGVCHLSVWRLKWEVSYVHQSVWRWKWFFCQSNYVLQRLRLCRTSDTVFRREIDSRRQWGYGTCYGGIVSPLRRSVFTWLLCRNIISIYIYVIIHIKLSHLVRYYMT